MYYYTIPRLLLKIAQTAQNYLCTNNKNPYNILIYDIEYSTISTETQAYIWAKMPIVKGDKLYKAIFSRRQIDDVPEYYECVSDLLNDPTVRQLDGFTHHKGTSRLQHCVNVSYYNYLLCRKLRLDARSAARAGILHDLFLYDRKEHEPVDDEGGHCSVHPKVAFFNASELFPINDKEGDMIANHMWPLSRHMPHSAEGWAIQLVDKMCATVEFCEMTIRRSRQGLRLAKKLSLTLLIRLMLIF